MDDGLYKDAVAWFTQFIRQWPDCLKAYCCLASSLMEIGDNTSAENILERILLTDPEFNEAERMLAKIYMKERRHEEAMELLSDSLLSDPVNNNTRLMLVECMNNAGEKDKAIGILKARLDVGDDNKDIMLKLASLYMENDEYDTALGYVDKVLDSHPDDPDVILIKANLLRLMLEYDESIELYKMLLKRYPDNPNIMMSLGSALAATGSYKPAIEYFNKSALFSKDNQEIIYNRGLARLASADLIAGWIDYEKRPSRLKIHNSIGIREWEGPEDKVNSLLVIGEQGIGDEVMFAGCLPNLLRDVKNCTVVIDARLAPVFECSFRNIRIIKKPGSGTLMNIRNIENHDAFIAMASLPLHYRRNEADFCSGNAYLQVNSEQKKYWNRKLSDYGDGLRLGLSWRGGQNRSIKQLRSIPLQKFHSILSNDGIVAVNLQYGDHAREISEYNNKYHDNLICFDKIDPLIDIGNFMALIANLDIVLSIDNSTVHFSGALGVRTWVLLPCYADWRWMNRNKHSLWYRSSKIFRQDKCLEWGPVLNEVKSELRKLSCKEQPYI